MSTLGLLDVLLTYIVFKLLITFTGPYEILAAAGVLVFEVSHNQVIHDDAPLAPLVPEVPDVPLLPLLPDVPEEPLVPD